MPYIVRLNARGLYDTGVDLHSSVADAKRFHSFEEAQDVANTWNELIPDREWADAIVVEVYE